MAQTGVLRALARGAAPRAQPRRWYGVLLRDPLALIGCAVVLALAVPAVLAPRLAPFDPPLTGDDAYFLNRSAIPHSPPFWDRSGDAPFVEDPDDPLAIYDRSLPYDPTYVLGTDSGGRDMLSLLLYGLRFSLPVGLLAVATLTVLGVALGLAAGWRGGAWDGLISRAGSIAEAVPTLVAYVLFAAVVVGPLRIPLARAGIYLGPVPFTALVLSSVGWAPVARLVRGQVRGLREREWVLAARATGVPGWRIALRHVLPYTVGTALIAASSQLPALLLVEGFLGAMRLWQRPPSDSLGQMILHEFVYTVRAPLFVLMPTVLVLALSLALTLISNGVRRALDPQRIG